MNIQRVTVKKDDTYYLCQPRLLSSDKEVFKCGVCLRGNINPHGTKKHQNHLCKICGAELHETVIGKGYDIKSYMP